MPFLCECDDAGCHAFVVATLPDYERVRKERLVIVARGHAVAGGELLCEDGDHDVYRLASATAATG